MPADGRQSQDVPSDDALLSVAGLGVRLSGRDVLDDVTFEVGRGELVGLIGANGAGKTTLMRAIIGLLKASSGSVVVRGAIGYVPQKVALDPDAPLRARDVVALGVDGGRLGIPLPSAARRAKVDALLSAVNATAFAEQRVGRLSGGQQQRVLIAHALAGDPTLLLLDEPLANLDIRSVQEVVELLARLAADRGVAVVLTAHDMNPLLPHLDRLVYLVDGRAVAGTADEVVRSDVLTELYGRRIDVLRVQNRVVVVAGDPESGAVTVGEA